MIIIIPDNKKVAPLCTVSMTVLIPAADCLRMRNRALARWAAPTRSNCKQLWVCTAIVCGILASCAGYRWELSNEYAR